MKRITVFIIICSFVNVQTNDRNVYEKLVEISSEKFILEFERKLPLIVMASDEMAKERFNSYQTTNRSDVRHSLKICENGELKQPSVSDQLCGMAAVKMFNDGLTTTFEGLELKILSFEHYTKCYDMMIENTDSIRQQVIGCPPFKIKNKYVDGFFLGQGDHLMNSAFVYKPNEKLDKVIILMYYILNILAFDMIRITHDEYASMRDDREIKLQFHANAESPTSSPSPPLFSITAQQYENVNSITNAIFLQNDICQMDEETARRTCKRFAFSKFSTFNAEEKFESIYVLKDLVADYTGFIPYKCLTELVDFYGDDVSISANGTTQVREIIYCPQQIIVTGDHYDPPYHLLGFFFSVNILDEKPILLYNYHSKNVSLKSIVMEEYIIVGK